MLDKIKRIAAVFLCGLILLAMPACVKKNGGATITDTAFYLDTVVTITLYGKSDQTLIKDAFKEIARLENLFSRTKRDSDIYKINKNAGVNYVEVSDETIELLNLSLKYHDISENAFDITVGPLILLWDIENGGYLPTQSELDEARSHIGCGKISIEGNRVMLQDNKMILDLGAIAKGYIADKVKTLLMSKGVESAVIDLGGNVLTIGSKPDGTEFNIGVQHPLKQSSEILGICSISDLSLVSSGNYERYFIKNGVRYHHILDPDTGAPSEKGIAGVTVLSEASVDGDALSTSIFVLGLQKGMELINSTDGVECLMVTTEGEVFFSDNMEQYFRYYE